MRKLLTILTCLGLAQLCYGADTIRDAHAQKTLEIYTHIIGVESSKNLGNVPKIANYLADELVAAGLDREDVEVVPLGETAALIAAISSSVASSDAERPWK